MNTDRPGDDDAAEVRQAIANAIMEALRRDGRVSYLLLRRARSVGVVIPPEAEAASSRPRVRRRRG